MQSTATLRHVLGYTWRHAVPALRLREVAEPGDDPAAVEAGPVQEVALSGELCLTPLAERRCVGRWDDERNVRLLCPYAAAVGRAGQCAACRQEEGMHACITCDGTRCPALPPAVERYCRQTHRLYLMDFGAGPVKVGTASDGRWRERVVEQGPVAAAYVAAAPGPAIKRLEKLAARLGMTERVAAGIKAEAVFRPADEATSRRRVLDAFDALVRGLPPGGETLHAPEFVDLPERYEHDARPGRVPLRRLPVRPGSTLRGTVLAARGGFLLLDVMEAPGVLDLAELRGRVVDLAAAPPALPPPAQLSLL